MFNRIMATLCFPAVAIVALMDSEMNNKGFITNFKIIAGMKDA